MQITNTSKNYGVVAISIHWLFTLLFYGVFALGVWMVELDYGNSWYYRGPVFHEGLGVLLGLLLLFRFLWRRSNRIPGNPENMRRFEIFLASVMHQLMYLLPVGLVITGYFISAAGDRSVPVFDWFVIPSIVPDVDGIESIAGKIHKWIAYVTVGLSVLHVSAALKHHFINKDKTLVRMLKVSNH